MLYIASCLPRNIGGGTRGAFCLATVLIDCTVFCSLIKYRRFTAIQVTVNK